MNHYLTRNRSPNSLLNMRLENEIKRGLNDFKKLKKKKLDWIEIEQKSKILQYQIKNDSDSNESYKSTDTNIKWT